MPNFLVCSEKVSLWCTCTALIFCLVFTMLAVLGLGVGLGYNSCFVDMKTRYKYVPAHYNYPGNPRYTYTEDYPPVYPIDQDFKPRRALDEDVEKLRKELAEEYDNMDNVHTSTTLDITFQDITSLQFSDLNTTTSKFITSDNVTDIFKNTTESANKETNKTVSLTSIVESERQSRVLDQKIAIPVSGSDILELLSKLRSNNKSYYLQIVAT